MTSEQAKALLAKHGWTSNQPHQHIWYDPKHRTEYKVFVIGSTNVSIRIGKTIDEAKTLVPTLQSFLEQIDKREPIFPKTIVERT